MNIKTKQKIAQALKDTSFAKSGKVHHSKKTSRLTSDRANEFILGVLFDRSVKSYQAWYAGEEISRILGDSDNPATLWENFVNMEKRRLTGFLRYGNGGNAFHRHYRTYAKQLPITAKTILKKYDGDPRKIWNNQRDINLVMKRLEELTGIGPALSRMTVNLLSRDYGLLGGMKAKKDLTVKPDVHVRRVFTRLGLIDKSTSIKDIDKIVKEISPRYPGALDYPAWEIGRNYCKATNPDCVNCEIRQVCNYRKN